MPGAEMEKFHRGKANCFAVKAISDNRRKSFAKPVKTIAAKAIISKPKPDYYTKGNGVDNRCKSFTGVKQTVSQ